MSYLTKKLSLFLFLATWTFPLMSLSHTVGSADTLYSLSRKYSVSIELIRRVNGLADKTIRRGDELLIPVDGESEIVVQPGDTLSDLATLFGVDQHTIMAVNNLVSGNIGIGQVLKIPPPTPRGHHRVVPGDTIQAIAERYAITPSRLKAYNGLEDDVIYPDQLLKVVPSHPEGYRISQGDSLWHIAKSYGIAMADLREWNGFKEGQTIHPGQVLKLYPSISNPISIAESDSPKPAVALASMRARATPKPELPEFGEYFYSKPQKSSQPNTTYWEGAKVSTAVDYSRALKVIEVFYALAMKQPRQSRKLEGLHVVIDPGHGGLDPGTIVSVEDGRGERVVVTEDEYVYDVALRVFRKLLSHGASVDLTIMAPDHHIRNGRGARLSFVNRKNEVYADKDHNRSLRWRPVGTIDGLDLRKTIAAKSIKNKSPSDRAKGTLFVSIHADNSPDLPKGSAVLYDGEGDGELAHSRAFAKIMAKHMGAGSFIKRQHLRVLRHNPADAAILVEVRNLHYKNNAWALRSDDLREQDAGMVVAGILDWATP